MQQLFFAITAILALTLATNVAADNEATFVVSVHDLLHEEMDHDGDGLKVLVRGYLSTNANIYLYPTKDQALISDISAILISDSDDGSIHAKCLYNYVEIIGRVSYTESRNMILIPIEVTTLSLDENRAASRNRCWAEKE